MYANRTHANRPSIRDQYDVARMRAAIARRDAALARARRIETYKAWLSVALISGVLVAMLRAF